MQDAELLALQRCWSNFWFPTWRKLKTGVCPQWLASLGIFSLWPTHMPDQGPFFQAEQGVARRATRERATMLSGLGESESEVLVLKNPWTSLKKSEVLVAFSPPAINWYTYWDCQHKPLWIDGWTIPKKGMVVEGWCGWSWNYEHFELIPSRSQTWQWEWEMIGNLLYILYGSL